MDLMKQLKAFKFQLKTNDLQAAHLRRCAGCCRLVWNKALALQKARLDEKQGILNYPKMARELIQWKHTENADINAAKNILAAGHAVLACGEAIRPQVTGAASMKHEPTEKVAVAA